MNYSEEMLEGIRQELIDGVESRKIPNYTRLDLQGRTDFYLAASALQKAIRRNLATEAETYAAALAQRHAAYLRRRLAIIGLEDVGQGAPQLAAMALLLATDADLRRRLGAERAYTWIAGELAAAPGDRTACNLIVAAAHHPERRDDLVRLRSSERLIASIEGAPRDLVQVIHVAGAIGELARRRQFADALAALAPDLDDLTLWISRTAHKLHLDGLGHGFLLAKVLNDVGRPRLVKSPLSTAMIGPWIAPALDRHTRPGFQAIRRFAEACSPLAQLLRTVRPSRRPNAASWLAFAAEGAVLRRRLAYRGSSELERWCAEACLASCPAPIGLLDEGTSIVLAHLGLLNALRDDLVRDDRNE